MPAEATLQSDKLDVRYEREGQILDNTQVLGLGNQADDGSIQREQHHERKGRLAGVRPRGPHAAQARERSPGIGRPQHSNDPDS